MNFLDYLPTLIFVIAYIIVFIIQKAQVNKQNSIVEKYEKMFSIINIDEIEKYIDLKEKSLKLSYENREVQIKKQEKKLEELLANAGNHINYSEEHIKKIENLFNKAQHIYKNANKILNEGNEFETKLNEIDNKLENEILDVKEDLKTKEKQIKEINSMLLQSFKKIENINLKNEIIDNLKKINEKYHNN